MEQVAVGSQFTIGNDEVGLASNSFIAKPKAYALYADPVSAVQGKKATVKILTKVSATLPTDAVDCAWKKKIRLFDRKLLAMSHKVGVNTADWLAENPAQNQPLALALRASSKQIPDQAVRTLTLAPPAIGTVEVNDATIEITGEFFGTKKPKIWLEYLVPGKGIKKLNCKLLPPDQHFDAKGKGLFMNPLDGASKAVVARPAKLPAGAADWNALTHVVVDNGCGIDAAACIW
jgi:hypothetical protein